MENAEKIGEILNSAGYPVSADAAEKFAVYLDFLTEYNRSFNLTSVDSSDAPVLHFADSLAAHGSIPYGASVLDIGSGGGFPGVPLKIFRDDISLTALDSNGKKCTFLRLLSAKIGVDFDVLCARAEEIGRKSCRGSFDIAVTRAVAELRILAEIGLPLIKKGGRLICYKAKLTDAEKAEGVRAFRECGGMIVAEKKFSLSGVERTLVVAEKTEDTPTEFPRRYKKILSSPL